MKIQEKQSFTTALSLIGKIILIGILSIDCLMVLHSTTAGRIEKTFLTFLCIFNIVFIPMAIGFILKRKWGCIICLLVSMAFFLSILFIMIKNTITGVNQQENILWGIFNCVIYGVPFVAILFVLVRNWKNLK
jgi:hypothetical protein